MRGIAVDGHGQLYAAGDSEIKVFDAAGRLKRRWPTSRPAHSVAVASDGAVYAGELGQIEIFDGAGKLLNTWRDEKLLGRVTAIGFTKDSVLAGDAADRAIRRFDRGGKFLNNIGKDNPVNGLLIPNGVVDFAVDAHDIIYAANPGKHRVERYTAGGELLGHIGRFDGHRSGGVHGLLQPDQRGHPRRHLHHGKGRPASQGLRFQRETAGGDRHRPVRRQLQEQPALVGRGGGRRAVYAGEPGRSRSSTRRKAATPGATQTAAAA